MKLTNAQWEAVRECFPEEEFKTGGRGRPFRSVREVLDAVLWIMRTGAPWADLPRRYPPYQTCHRRFQRWAEGGVMPKVLAKLREDLAQRGGVENIEAFIDGSYVPAKKGDPVWDVAGRGRLQKSWQSQTAMVFHSLSILREETDTIPFSPKQLSILLSWENYLRD
jgi:transposase